MSTTSSFTQAELTSKKVNDLKTILAGFKQPTTGVKSELISRILEYQRDNSDAAGSSTSTDLPAAGNALGPIPGESELPSSKAAVAEEAKPSTSSGSASTAPATTEDKSKAAEGAANDKTSKESEAERRKQRLQRFGNTEELAKLERAEKFGTSGADGISDQTVSKLDSELSNKRMRVNANGASKPTGGKSAPATPTSAKPVSKGKPNAEAKKSAADPAEEERRRKRAERFAPSQ